MDHGRPPVAEEDKDDQDDQEDRRTTRESTSRIDSPRRRWCRMRPCSAFPEGIFFERRSSPRWHGGRHQRIRRGKLVTPMPDCILPVELQV